METHIKQTDLDPDLFITDEDTGMVTKNQEIVGLDLSAFDRKPKQQVTVIKDFSLDSNNSVITIYMEIPNDVEVAVLSIHKLEGNLVTELKIDYQYDNVNKRFQFATGQRGISGRIILAFYK